MKTSGLLFSAPFPTQGCRKKVLSHFSHICGIVLHLILHFLPSYPLITKLKNVAARRQVV